MKLWELVLAGVGGLLAASSAWALHRWSLPQQHVLVEAGGCRTPVTILNPPESQIPLGSVVVFHGLAANSRLMLYLSTVLARAGGRVYVPDLPGHGSNTDPFAFARAQHCATATVEYLVRTGQADPNRTVLLGHSMGGAIAIRMADRDPALATIAISPAPLVAPRRMPSNLLIFSAGLDMAPLQREAQALAQAAGGERTGADDFMAHRAFHLEIAPHATHTSLILSPRVAEQSANWINNSLFPLDRAALGLSSWDAGVWAYATAQFHQDTRIPSTLGLIGLMLLFPLCAAIAGSIAGPRSDEPRAAPPRPLLALAEGSACSLLGVLLLALGVPLQFLRLHSGDYLASLLLIVGLLLLALNHAAARNQLASPFRAIAASGALGLVTILAVGGWLNWQTTAGWLNAPRWLRFAEILPVAWLFCYAEEILLGPVGRGKRRALRFAVLLLLRAELWLACAFAYYTIQSGQVLLLLLVIFLAIFSVLQRLAADALRRRTGAPAAALFGAILAAWFIAAVFPLT